MSECKNPMIYEKVKHPFMVDMPYMHYHDKHELYYLVEGSTKYFIEDELFAIKPGEMIFIPKNVYHKTTSDAERVLLFFDENDVGENLLKYIDELFENKHIIIKGKYHNKVTELLYKIEKEENDKKIGYRDMQNLYTRELLILISRHRAEESSEKETPSHQLIQDVAKYISSNYAEDLSLKVLSEHFAITPNYLSKQFKKLTSVGLSDYINITRVAAAEKLLVTTNLSITEIAFLCGFNDSNYFAAVFKKIKGITPKKYSLVNK